MQYCTAGLLKYEMLESALKAVVYVYIEESFHFCFLFVVSISNGTADGGTFRGFFVQARQVSNDANRVGIFAPIGAESRLSSCAIDTVSRFG